MIIYIYRLTLLLSWLNTKKAGSEDELALDSVVDILYLVFNMVKKIVKINLLIDYSTNGKKQDLRRHVIYLSYL